MSAILKQDRDTVCKGIIKGVVLDEKKVPVIGAVVSLINSEAKTVANVSTDLEGTFIIGQMANGDYSLHIRYLGYHAVTLKGIVVNSECNSELEVWMMPTYGCMPGGPVIHRSYGPGRPGTHTFKRQDINRMPIR